MHVVRHITNERFDENVFDQEQKHSFPDTLPINVRKPIRTFSKKKKKKKKKKNKKIIIK